jgi:hypothetical protein
MLSLFRRAGLAAGICLSVTACGDSTSKKTDTTPDAAKPDSGATPGAPDAGAGADSGAAADGGLPPMDYAKADSWVCGPNAKQDYCLEPLTATAVEPDGTTKDVSLDAAADPKIDCFYVYPTVAIVDPVGNKTDFDNVADILDPVMAQAAPLRQACKVFAPFYRQITIQAYQDPGVDGYLETAYADVAAAFRYYVDHLSNGRKFVLAGHSQGAHMLRRLIQREIEKDDALRARMLLALPIGPIGDIVVPKGKKVGGTFQKVPLCSTDDETGCVITFSSFAKGYEPTALMYPAADGMEAGCTNPGALGGGSARLSGSTFPVHVHQTLLDPGMKTDVTSQFVVYGDLFTGECTTTPNGISYLQIDADPQSGDKRENPVPFDAPLLSPGAPYYLGLHVLDYGFPSAEIVAAVKTRADKL